MRKYKIGRVRVRVHVNTCTKEHHKFVFEILLVCAREFPISLLALNSVCVVLKDD